MRREDYLWQLPAAIEARLGESTYGRQRAIYEDDHLLIILHTPPDADTDDRTAQVFLRSPNGRYQCNGLENGEIKLKKLLATYGELLQQNEVTYARARSASDLHTILERMMPVHRSASNLSTALQSARDLVRDDAFLIGMRDEAYEVSRGLELLLHDARLTLDYRIAHSAEEQAEKTQELARAQHKLNVLAAITFPLIAVATLFGMNLATGLENRPPALFWFIFAVGLGVGLVAMRWVQER